jgi:hypothetical protein
MNLFKYINYYPLYVPVQNRGTLDVLAKGGVRALISELERLSTLGSSWASATLGYLSLLPSAEGTRDPERAIALCTKPAVDGDPYSLFVLGWARLVLTKDSDKSVSAMLEASNKKFLPATLAMSFFVWSNTEAALQFVNEAGKRGHKAAWAYRCRLYRSGRAGIMRRFFGFVMTPFARLYYLIALRSRPLCSDVLVMNPIGYGPVFRVAK